VTGILCLSLTKININWLINTVHKHLYIRSQKVMTGYILKLEKPETCSLFTVDYGLYPLYLHSAARSDVRNTGIYCN
jgi:hypothetical protein